jgi:Tat protein translocase TatB subunit
MFNVGGPEVLVILLVALIVLGPQQLPKAVRSVGNVMSELRRMSGGFQDEIRNALDMSTETQARHDGAQLARRPEDADVTETVVRNTDPPIDTPEHDVVSSNGATALSDLPPLEPRDHERPDWVPSDRASG